MHDGQVQYLTTREVADLLRVKERKVYDLAAAGEIPHRRITGKLLFPAAELSAWIEGGVTQGTARPAVLSGSHDPLLDWAVRESGAGLATLLNGSADGVEVFAGGGAAMAGLHIPDAEGWNIAAVSAAGLRDAVLIAWAVRARGLILGRDVAGVTGVADLIGRRVVRRQAGAGAAALMESLLTEQGMSLADLGAAGPIARTESDAAAAVAAGEADAALGIEAMARRFDLPFVPLVSETYDLLIDRRSYFTPPVQTLLTFARTTAFADKARSMGGYDLTPMGGVRWLSA